MSDRERVMLPRRRPGELSTSSLLHSSSVASAPVDQDVALQNGHLFSHMRLGPPVALFQRKEPQSDGTTGVTTTSAPAPAESAINPLVGLKRGDGLNYGTWDLRPRVKLLQHKLNEKTGAGLNVDGMWGPKTSAALEAFMLGRSTVPAEIVDQDTADALLDRRKETPGPGPQPNIPGPQPVEPAYNQTLEDVLDAVWLQYQLTFAGQQSGLHKLEKDLAQIEKPKNALIEVLKDAGKAALDALLGWGGGALRSPIKAALAGLGETIAKDGVDKVFDKAQEAAGGEVVRKVDELGSEDGPTLETFLESQRSALEEASAQTQENFLLETRARLRQPAAGEPVSSGPEDPRVLRARKLLDAVKRERPQAFQKQYNESLAKWAIAQAQSKLGSIDSPSMSVGDEKVKTTDMSKAEPGMPGVLTVEIEGTRPELPVKVIGAKIAGLSEKTRQALERQQKSILELGIPRYASGKVEINTGLGSILNFTKPTVRIAQNETGDLFERESTEGGKEWLKKKARPYQEILTEDLVKEGMRMVWEEIDRKRLSDVPGGLKGP
ncbi:peptidoglycan-binding domain-containing protein [Roseiflexus sp.]|uniref:peptidoglycan-binding domain-containing protein n=1 Tax=Roseiflexus sp. TaxID=2562120 RepID=UPI00398B0C52